MDILIEHLGQGLALILMLSLPAVLTAASVGLIVGIIQAVTQVQEQTISAAPKIVLVFLLIIMGGGLMMNMLTNYLRQAVHLAFNEIPQDAPRVLPPKLDGSNRKKFFQNTGTFGKSKFPTGASSSLGDKNNKGKTLFQNNTQIMPKPGTAESLHIQKRKTQQRSGN
ncbi:MAG: flagellar biosynthetic protein FliQ [Vampirovibrio sp.]|nr:flagellar biosynthetic protein FliQ [Vampirovibrio sp.]